MAKKISIKELTSIDLEKTTDENVKNILDNLSKNNISHKQLTNFYMTNSMVGNKDELAFKTDINFKVHQDHFKKELEKDIKTTHPKISSGQLKEAVNQSVLHMKGLMDKLQNNPTDKQLANELLDLTKIIAKSINLTNSKNMKQETKQEEQTSEINYKKGDVLFYKRMDTDKNYRVGEVLQDSTNEKEITLKEIDYNSKLKDFEVTDNLVQIDKDKLSPPFRYKNLNFFTIDKDARFKLLQGKATNFLKAENTYKKTVDGKSVQKLYEETIKIKLATNKDGKLDIKIDNNFSLSNEKAYGKEIKPEDLEKLKKGVVLLNNNVTKQGKDYFMVMAYNKKLATVITKGIDVNYLLNKENEAQKKAYIQGSELSKPDIEKLFNEGTLKIGKKEIGFAINNDLTKWNRKIDGPVQQKKKDEKIKKEEKIKITKPKRNKGRKMSR